MLKEAQEKKIRYVLEAQTIRHRDGISGIPCDSSKPCALLHITTNDKVIAIMHFMSVIYQIAKVRLCTSDTVHVCLYVCMTVCAHALVQRQGFNLHTEFPFSIWTPIHGLLQEGHTIQYRDSQSWTVRRRMQESSHSL